MKYIRTKDKIFETTRLPLERFSIELTKMIDKQIGLPNPHIEEIEIIKQADTIKELCDEFRVRDNDNYSTYEIDITCRDLKELYEELQIQNQTLFGAIWTDKGLIYVAKMNEKGELELL